MSHHDEPDHGHRHEHGPGHGHVHRSSRLVSSAELAPRAGPVHRLGRRQFLTELGRNTFAVAILGGFAAACSSDESDPTAASPSPSVDPTGPIDPTDPADPDEGPGTADPTGADDTAARTQPAAGTLRWSQVSLGNVSAYVLVRGNDAAVVDTGNPGAADQIGTALAALGAGFGDVRHVVLTHHHPDHIGSLPEVLQRADSASAYAGEADIGNITAPIDVQAVGDGDDVFGLQVIETPGHTPGSISVLDTGIGLLLAGDALNGNADGTGISGANERFTADMGAAGDSIRKLGGFDFEAAGFGHGNPVESGADDLVRALAGSL